MSEEGKPQMATIGKPNPKEEAERAIRPVYKDLNDDQKEMIALIKNEGVELYASICNLPASRETSLAKTKLEEAIMWAVKAITK